MHGSQEVVDGTIADLAAVFDPFSTAFRKWKPTRMRERPFSSAGLGEAGVRTQDRRRIVARAPGRQRQAAGAEADVVGTEEPLQHLRPRAAFDACAES